MPQSSRVATSTIAQPGPLALPALVAALGGGLARLGQQVHGPEIDDVTLAEPGSGVYGQANDLLLGVGIESVEAAVGLLEAAARVGSGGVVLRRATARRREVRAAARRVGMSLVELADHASWAHVVWLLRGVLDRAAFGSSLRADGPVLDELFALADACAALVDAPVTIEDTQSRVLAYSSRQDVSDPIRVSTIVGRKVPDAVLRSLRGRGVFRRLARSSEPFYVPADGELKPRLVVPVRAADEWLGSIWAVVTEPPAAGLVRSLEQTASVVALHLLRMRAEADLSRRLAADRIRAVLSGDGSDAAWLPAGPWRVVALAGGAASDPARSDLATRGVDTDVDLWESAARRRSWRQPHVAVVDGQVVAVVRDNPGDTSPGSWSWLREVVAEVDVGTRTARAGAGSAVDRPALLARSHGEAREVLHLVTRGAVAGTSASLEEAWAPVTTERAVSGIRDLALLGPLTALGEHDHEHGTQYLPTLAAWLDHPGDPRAAAARAHVHVNTLRYRMQRLSEVVDLDTHDPQQRLALRLQLQALGL